MKAFRTVLLFLSFKGLIHAYLVKTSITDYKCLTLLFVEDNDSISANAAAHIVLLNLTRTFLLLNFHFLLFQFSFECSFTLIPVMNMPISN